MSSLISNILRFILFIMVQAMVLNHVPPLHQYVVPYLYYLFILWLPFSINRVVLLLTAFAFGLTLDYFTGTLGLHTAPCVLIAYLRPFLLGLIISQESKEISYTEPSNRGMGFTLYALYIALLTFIHHAYLVFIEWLQFGDIVYFLGKTLSTTAVSLLLVLITEMLFYRRGEFRTNAG